MRHKHTSPEVESCKSHIATNLQLINVGNNEVIVHVKRMQSYAHLLLDMCVEYWIASILVAHAQDRQNENPGTRVRGSRLDSRQM